MRYDEVSSEISHVPYRMLKKCQTIMIRVVRALLTIKVDKKSYAPQEIAAKVLQKLETSCRKLFGD